MKKVILVMAAAALAACASHESKVFSTDTSQLRVGEKPQGFPRTYVVAKNGNCSKVTENWVSNGSYNGKDMWVIDKTLEPVPCQ
ncbi:hypothetical protein [Pseudomonas sp. IT-P100]|uniref:hypothetical protein n=1 Tax=Pseudomonas sp. IT-P100 TaxID=3026452 RepID=UPI0039E1C03A